MQSVISVTRLDDELGALIAREERDVDSAPVQRLAWIGLPLGLVMGLGRGFAFGFGKGVRVWVRERVRGRVRVRVRVGVGVDWGEGGR